MIMSDDDKWQAGAYDVRKIADVGATRLYPLELVRHAQVSNLPSLLLSTVRHPTHVIDPGLVAVCSVRVLHDADI